MAGMPKRKLKKEIAAAAAAADAVKAVLADARPEKASGAWKQKDRTRHLVLSVVDDANKDLAEQRATGTIDDKAYRQRRHLVDAFQLTAIGMLEAGIPPASVAGAILEGMGDGSGPDFGAMGAAMVRVQKQALWAVMLGDRLKEEADAEEEAERRLKDGTA